MHGVALLIAAAALAHLAARRYGLPPIPLMLLAGVALSRATEPPPALLENALVVGASFLLFLAGLELDPRRMRAQTRAAVEVGCVHMLVLTVGGYAASVGLGLAPRSAAYVAVGLAGSSTLVGVSLLRARGRMYEPLGRLALGVLLLQDLLVLASIPLLAAERGGWLEAGLGLAAVAALAAFAIAVRAWGTPALVRVADEPELVLLGALSLLFAFLAIGNLLGLPTVVGSFLAGVALARFPANLIARPQLAPVGDFFSALFFTALGGLVQDPTPALMLQAAVLGILLVLVTVPLVTVLVERAGFPAKAAIESGLLLSQASELALVVGLAGMLEGDVGLETFTLIALVTLMTMLLTPFLATDRVAERLVAYHPSRRRAVGASPPHGHVLLLGAGSTGTAVLEELMIVGTQVVVVDEDPAVIAGLTEAGIAAEEGDVTDRGVLVRAGADRARVVISTIHRPRENQALLELTRSIPVLVRVFDAADAEWVRARGGTPLLYSEAAADALMDWFDENEGQLADRGRARVAAPA
jgi:Kef-type K+ transport system membrane component KefB